MRTAGLVVVVDGPTYVGCSTTIAGLQAVWPRVRAGPLLAIGLDASVAALGPGERRWRQLIRAHEPPHGDEHLVWGPLGRELVGGLHRAAAAWAGAGLDVAIDHMLPDSTTAADLAAALDGLDVLHVGLVCDPDVLEEREREGGSPEPGTAVAQLRATREVVERDLVLDTTEATTEELVEAILAELERRARG